MRAIFQGLNIPTIFRLYEEMENSLPCSFSLPYLKSPWLRDWVKLLFRTGIPFFFSTTNYLVCYGKTLEKVVPSWSILKEMYKSGYSGEFLGLNLGFTDFETICINLGADLVPSSGREDVEMKPVEPTVGKRKLNMDDEPSHTELPKRGSSPPQSNGQTKTRSRKQNRNSKRKARCLESSSSSSDTDAEMSTSTLLSDNLLYFFKIISRSAKLRWLVLSEGEAIRMASILHKFAMSLQADACATRYALCKSLKYLWSNYILSDCKVSPRAYVY